MAVRIISSWSEAVTAIATVIMMALAVRAAFQKKKDDQDKTDGSTKPRQRRRRTRLWLVFGASFVAAVISLIITHFDSSHSHRPERASTTVLSHRPVIVTPTTAELAQRATTARRKQLNEQLKQFIKAAMEHSVNCTPNKQLSSTVVAQQVCHFGDITAVYTRLDSTRATQTFLMARYLNSFPFSGDAGRCRAYYPFRLASPWRNGQGEAQGYWVFRTSGSDVILLWEYRSHRVVVRASQRATAPVSQLCEFWYSHGETP